MGIDEITIGIAAYRRQDGLRQALVSLSEQGYDRLHIIVGDDSSGGEALEIVDKFSRLRVTYVHNKPRKGVLGNHVSLFNYNQSEFFMFHGDDDYLLPNALNLLSETLKTSEYYGQVFGSYHVGKVLVESRRVDLAKFIFVRFWGSRFRIVRLVSFFLCPAFVGKANLFYGLYRSHSLKAVDMKRALPERGFFLNMDEMIAYQATCNHPTLIVSRPCHFFAEGNEKLYKARITILSGTLGAFLELMFYEFVSVFDYLRNSEKLHEKVLVAVLFPAKLLSTLMFRYFLWRK